MASKKKKCPYTNFFYPFNLGLGPRAQLMLLLYEDITLIELYTRSYKEILKVHKRKIILLSRELPGLLSLLLPGCSISGCSLPARRGKGAQPPLIGPMPQSIDNLLHTRFPGDTLKDIMIAPQTDWDPDFMDKSQELWDTGYPLIYLSIPDGAKQDVQILFADHNFLEVMGADCEFNTGYHTTKKWLRDNGEDKKLKLIEQAMNLGVLSNYPHSHEDFGNGLCCHPGEGCVRTEDPQSYCNLVEENGNGGGPPRCSAQSIICNDGETSCGYCK